MYHSLRRFHPPPGKAMQTPLTVALPLRLTPLDGRLIARHPCGPPATAQLSFQPLYTPSQFGNHRPLSGDRRQQGFLARILQVYFSFHLSLITLLTNAALGILRFIPSSLNSYGGESDSTFPVAADIMVVRFQSYLCGRGALSALLPREGRWRG